MAMDWGLVSSSQNSIRKLIELSPRPSDWKDQIKSRSKSRVDDYRFLFAAAERGHYDIVEFLIVNQKVDFQLRDDEGFRLFSKISDIEIVKLFLRNGFNPNVVSDSGFTLLSYCISEQCKSRQWLELMLVNSKLPIEEVVFFAMTKNGYPADHIQLMIDSFQKDDPGLTILVGFSHFSIQHFREFRDTNRYLSPKRLQRGSREEYEAFVKHSLDILQLALKYQGIVSLSHVKRHLIQMYMGNIYLMSTGDDNLTLLCFLSIPVLKALLRNFTNFNETQSNKMCLFFASNEADFSGFVDFIKRKFDDIRFRPLIRLIASFQFHRSCPCLICAKIKIDHFDLIKYEPINSIHYSIIANGMTPLLHQVAKSPFISRELRELLRHAAKPWNIHVHSYLYPPWQRHTIQILMIVWYIIETRRHLPYLPFEMWSIIINLFTFKKLARPPPLNLSSSCIEAFSLIRQKWIE